MRKAGIVVAVVGLGCAPGAAPSSDDDSSPTDGYDPENGLGTDDDVEGDDDTGTDDDSLDLGPNAQEHVCQGNVSYAFTWDLVIPIGGSPPDGVVLWSHYDPAYAAWYSEVYDTDMATAWTVSEPTGWSVDEEGRVLTTCSWLTYPEEVYDLPYEGWFFDHYILLVSG